MRIFSKHFSRKRNFNYFLVKKNNLISVSWDWINFLAFEKPFVCYRTPSDRKSVFIYWKQWYWPRYTSSANSVHTTYCLSLVLGSPETFDMFFWSKSKKYEGDSEREMPEKNPRVWPNVSVSASCVGRLQQLITETLLQRETKRTIGQ
jgi:hypothetical protein